MNGPRIQQIKAELACCKQRGLAIESYFGKLNRIWDSLAMYRPLRTCKCGQCTCDLGTAQEADREEDKVHQFLFGLDDQFRAVRSSLVARSPVQPLEEVYNIVRQEEDLRTSGEERSEVTAFVAQTKTRFRGESTGVCKHCNRSGHASENCYAVIGYPEWWGDRPRSRTLQGRGRVGSSGSSSSGGRGRGQAYANCVNVPSHDTQNKTQANFVLTDQDRDGVSGLTEQQWCSLKNIINGTAKSKSLRKKDPYALVLI
ncbi:hypothetical protein N665_3932s0002 [Sinapis alba]|nr:hypothetical protein N665_3932s0002 [Sinapis alba]